jgi:hypothetical protein
MTDEEIRKLIDELRNRNKYDEAYIGFFEYGGGPDESFIKANRQGLELHAADLLEAALETDSEFGSVKSKNFGLDEKIADEQSDFIFNYIELYKEKRNEIKPNIEYKETWKGKAYKFGCFSIGVLFVVLMIIGFITVFTWF